MTRNSRNPRHRRRFENNLMRQLRRKVLIGCAIVFVALLIIAFLLISNGVRNKGQNIENPTETYDLASNNGESSDNVEQKDKVSFVLTALR